MHALLAASAVCAALVSSASSFVIERQHSPADGLPAGWSYHGCFQVPQLSEAAFVGNGDMTREICASFCERRSYKSAGIAQGDACYCWNTPESGFSYSTEAQCLLPCSGDSRQACGGSNALSVFTSFNPSAPLELRAAPIRKRKCGGKPTGSSSSVSQSQSSTTTVPTYPVTSMSSSTASSTTVTSTESSLTSTSTSSVQSSSQSSVSSETSSSTTTASSSSSVLPDTSSSTTDSSTISSSTSTFSTSTETSSIPSTSTTTSSESLTSTFSSSTSTETSSSVVSTTTTSASESTTSTSSSASETITSTSTESSTSSSTSSTTSSATACATATGTYVIQASNSGDFTADGNFAQLQQAFGNGYRVLFSANRQNAQQFRLNADCMTFATADGGLIAMVGDNAPLHYQYFFPSVEDARATVNVDWEVDVCSFNADQTVSCTVMGQSIFQITQGDPTLEIGDQLYGEPITLNLVPVPGTIF
ncbi:hypothetical protein JX266_012055 [Neoarthrinium moseri]|nr:hypothetical protein JX266_012055 [Neoarthrinium moseri]